MRTPCAADLPILKTASGEPALCLVTGATGYIGGRLIRELLLTGYRVRVLARGAERLRDHEWINSVEVIDGDARDPKALAAALAGVDVAYYLLHALMSSTNFEQEENLTAELFAAAAKSNNVKRIVYLGGLAPAHQELSDHLRSRVETGRILHDSGVPTIELRAGVVIGSGSASFEMLRYLTERLPAMITPKWVNTRIQPIAVRDVLRYLVGSAAIDSSISDAYDIGGPDVFTYVQMMQAYAKAAGLRKRIIVPVPVLTPNLSSGWVGLVTPVPLTLARRLVESLKNEVICKDDRIRSLIPDPPQGLTNFHDAVELALTRIKEADVATRWTNASTPGAPSEALPTDPDWAGGTLYSDIREVQSSATPAQLWKFVEGIGGDHGYYTATFAWELRGFLDRIVGGAGLRRGRRDAEHLREGDALDFWRVEALERPKLLRLRAEMKLPGLAWLEFVIEPTATGSKLIQRALFVPKGLFGHAYWWSISPLHGFVFPGMAKHLVQAAEKAAATTNA
jgi:uncharacterized protein YbjT (DUF2867 family)